MGMGGGLRVKDLIVQVTPGTTPRMVMGEGVVGRESAVGIEMRKRRDLKCIFK